MRRPGAFLWTAPWECSGGRERPPYIAAGIGRQRINGSPQPGLPAGRCRGAAAGQRGKPPDAGTPPAVPGSITLLPCIVGRAFTPAGGLAAARKDIGGARRGTPPSSLTRCHLPLQGRLLGGSRLQSLPCKGLRSRAPPAADTARRSRCSGRRAQACFSARRAMWAPQTGRWMHRKAQTEGCIAALLHRYPKKPGRALPRVRRGRCLHRPANPALPQTPSGGRDRPPYKAPVNGQ